MYVYLTHIMVACTNKRYLCCKYHGREGDVGVLYPIQTQLHKAASTGDHCISPTALNYPHK